MIDVLKNHTPDIMGTQEGLKFQTMAIKDAFENWEESGLGVYHNILALNPRRPYEDMDGCSCRILYDASKFDLLDQGTFWQSDTLTRPYIEECILYQTPDTLPSPCHCLSSGIVISP